MCHGGQHSLPPSICYRCCGMMWNEKRTSQLSSFERDPFLLGNCICFKQPDRRDLVFCWAGPQFINVGGRCYVCSGLCWCFIISVCPPPAERYVYPFTCVLLFEGYCAINLSLHSLCFAPDQVYSTVSTHHFSPLHSPYNVEGCFIVSLLRFLTKESFQDCVAHFVLLGSS